VKKTCDEGIEISLRISTADILSALSILICAYQTLKK
jgi:hypothetical protein